jgi:hypothetical protein
MGGIARRSEATTLALTGDGLLMEALMRTTVVRSLRVAAKEHWASRRFMRDINALFANTLFAATITESPTQEPRQRRQDRFRRRYRCPDDVMKLSSHRATVGGARSS